MRNKALLGLAALAVTAATCVAQSNVYSLNIVGYINVTAKPGYNLIANQLNTGTNGLDQVLPASPIETQVLKYSGGAYVADISDGSTWINADSGLPSLTTVSPGEGFFYLNPALTDKVVTLVGEVKTGTNLTVTCVPNGYSLVSSIAPQAISLTAANGFPQVLEALYLSYANPPGSYTTLINDGTEWLDNDSGVPTPAIPQVGQGFFILNPTGANMNWVRDFVP